MKTKKIIAILMFAIFSIVAIVSNEKDTIAIGESYDFYTIQPEYEYESWQTEGSEKIPLPPDATNQADIISAPVNYILTKFPNLTYSLALKDDEVTPEAIKNLKPHQIVLWQGHGDWLADSETITLNLAMTQPFSFYVSNPDYQADIENGRLVQANDGYSTGITAKYIETYSGDLTGSVIYLGSCESAHEGNDQLAQAFLNKGAAAVIANTHRIDAIYGNIMQYTTTRLLAEINPETNNYYTLGEALAKAKETYGENDKSVGPEKDGAEPIIFGDANFRLASIPPTPAEIEENPNTGEHITFYIAVTAISLVGLIGVSLLIFEKIKR